MRILVIDNYDSFVYNLVQLLREADARPQVDVVMNDAAGLYRKTGGYDGLLISPGPGLPAESNALMECIGSACGRIPVLGVCLGHQAIAEYFGASLRQLSEPKHGHRSCLHIADKLDPLLENVREGAAVGRYHSWVVDAASLPPALIVSSTDEEENVMSFRHRSLPIHGIQFHPESYISECGKQIIGNWLAEVQSRAGMPVSR